MTLFSNMLLIRQRKVDHIGTMCVNHINPIARACAKAPWQEPWQPLDTSLSLTCHLHQDSRFCFLTISQLCLYAGVFLSSQCT